MVTSEEINQLILKISRTHGQKEPKLVPHMPYPEAIATNCMANVQKVIDQYGGSIKYGWTFFHRYSTQYGDYLFVNHHAIWLNTKGFLIDVTPFHDEEKHKPKTVDNKVLFLEDDSAIPIRKGEYIIPLPNKFYSIRPNPKIDAYVGRLQEKENRYYKDQFDIDL